MYKSLEKTPAVARKETPRHPETTVHRRLDEFILYCCHVLWQHPNVTWPSHWLPLHFRYFSHMLCTLSTPFCILSTSFRILSVIFRPLQCFRTRSDIFPALPPPFHTASASEHVSRASAHFRTVFYLYWAFRSLPLISYHLYILTSVCIYVPAPMYVPLAWISTTDHPRSCLSTSAEVLATEVE